MKHEQKKYLMINDSILDLSSGLEIGKGSSRVCFLHPHDRNKCIKITHLSHSKETMNEVKYYKILKKRGIVWDFLSKYYGSVETSLGKGEVYDLIRDYDGKVSKTLSFYLQKEERTKTLENPILLLANLKKYTLKQGIVVKDLNTKNILYQKNDEINVKLIIIDGIANNDHLPFSKYISYFREKKIKRLWKRFEESLPQKYFFNKYFLSLLNEKRSIIGD